MKIAMQRMTRFSLYTFVATCSFIFSITTAYASNKHDEQFLQWLTNFSKEAAQKGVSQSTYNKAFKNVTAPDEKVLEKANYQPEFTQTIWDYLDPRVNEGIVMTGLKMAEKHKTTLSSIEKELGVSRNIILAIWSMETAYGAILQHKNRFYPVPHALATLAYADKKRSKFGKTQLLAALQILEAGDISHKEMLGSWAGAMGHTQFIPTSYLAYGLDWDNNGQRDIWNSIPDALATAANLLKENGWRTDKTWGYEIITPTNGHLYEDQTKTLAEWSTIGFSRPAGKTFPRPSERAELKFLAGPEGPGFLLIKNFFVIKRYNNSNFYALAVGLLSDRIAGYAAMTQEWPRPSGSLNVDQKFELQKLLQKTGYYTGDIDGWLGKNTKQAIKSFQEHANIPVDGEPSTSLLILLRKNI